jgi:ankyrin repeat protein
VITVLLTHPGAPLDLNAVTKSNWTPLMLACSRKGNKDVVTLLLDAGANPLIGGANETPIKLATDLGEHAVVELLQRRRPPPPTTTTTTTRPTSVTVPAKS